VLSAASVPLFRWIHAAGSVGALNFGVAVGMVLLCAKKTIIGIQFQAALVQVDYSILIGKGWLVDFASTDTFRFFPE
jgi:hypothetical protein